MSIELEEMSEEQLKKLQEYLRSCIGELENERDWREAEDLEVLPLLSGLTRYLAREYLNEDTVDEFEHDYDSDDGDDPDDELNELEF